MQSNFLTFVTILIPALVYVWFKASLSQREARLHYVEKLGIILPAYTCAECHHPVPDQKLCPHCEQILCLDCRQDFMHHCTEDRHNPLTYWLMDQVNENDS